MYPERVRVSRGILLFFGPVPFHPVLCPHVLPEFFFVLTVNRVQVTVFHVKLEPDRSDL
jgi:hypothetical protein